MVILCLPCFILVCDRLEAFERDENFSSGPDTEVGPVYHMDSPQLVSDEDINNSTDMQVVLHVYCDRHVDAYGCGNDVADIMWIHCYIH